MKGPWGIVKKCFLRFCKFLFFTILWAFFVIFLILARRPLTRLPCPRVCLDNPALVCLDNRLLGAWIIDCSGARIIDFSGAGIIYCSGALIIDFSGAWIIDC